MFCRLVFMMVWFTTVTHGKPTTTPQPEAGPCVGMDCLHGVLMHGDEDIGEEHKAEDQYIRFKEELKTGAPEKSGPCEGENCLHELMHDGDGHSGSHDEDNGPIGPNPANGEQPGPEDPEQYFHGVLMHGDGEAGRAHAHEEDKGDVVKMDIPVDPQRMAPQDLDEYWHGVLMHNDSEPGETHHAPGEGHNAESDSDSTEERGNIRPLSGEDMMHGVLMHGDEDGGHHHESESESEESSEEKPIQPLSGEDMMHGMLMHGEEGTGSQHHKDEIAADEYATKHPKNVQLIGPDPNDLHGILMHGDEKSGHDHTEEDREKFAEVKDEGVAMVTDPESVLHPEGYHGDDPKKIDMNKIDIKDKADFAKWEKKDKKSTEERKKDLESDSWGQTLGFITDSLFNDIDLMKKRYLSRFYGTEDDSSSDSSIEDEWIRAATKDNGHEHADEDMRHELNLVGNTGPLDESQHDHSQDSKE